MKKKSGHSEQWIEMKIAKSPIEKFLLTTMLSLSVHMTHSNNKKAVKLLMAAGNSLVSYTHKAQDIKMHIFMMFTLCQSSGYVYVLYEHWTTVFFLSLMQYSFIRLCVVNKASFIWDSKEAMDKQIWMETSPWNRNIAHI